MSLKSFLNTARQTISGASTPAPGTPAENTPIDGLFLKVDPAVDGENCDHDCESCHVNYPRGFKIDEGDKLYGYVKGWSTHVLVATGKTDWVRDVADEKGSVMEAIDKKADVKVSNGVSNSQFIVRKHSNFESRDSCYLPRTFPLHHIPRSTTNRQQSSSSPPSS
jgi:hypothetical protein